MTDNPLAHDGNVPSTQNDTSYGIKNKPPDPPGDRRKNNIEVEKVSLSDGKDVSCMVGSKVGVENADTLMD